MFAHIFLVVDVLARWMFVGQTKPGVDIFPECPDQPKTSEVCEAKDSGGGLFGPGSLFANILQIVIYVVGSIAVLMMIIGALRYVLSGGDANSTSSAKSTIIHALIGLVIALSAQFILTFVIKRL